MPLTVDLSAAIRFAEHLEEYFDPELLTPGGPSYRVCIKKKLIEPLRDAEIALRKIRRHVHTSRAAGDSIILLLNGEVVD